MRNLIPITFLVMLTACSIKGGSYLSGECDLPCWNQIIPGTTHVDDAMETLSDLESIKPKSIVEIQNPRHGYDREIQWDFRDGGRGSILIQGTQVVSMDLFNLEDFSLNDFILSNGQPDSILPTVEAGDYFYPRIDFLYPKIGVRLVYVGLDQNLLSSQPFSINSEMDIYRINIMPPEELNAYLCEEYSTKLALNCKSVINLIEPWTGFGEIKMEF